MTNIDKKTNKSSSREAVLNAAEELFTIRGYKNVKLKHIADNLGIKQASIYYHFPLGKEDLYVEVMLRHLEHRHTVLKKLIAQANPDLESCLRQLGIWLIKQPPLNGARMILTDLPQLSPEKAVEIESAMYRCAFAPIEDLFIKYRSDLQDNLRESPGFIGGTFLSAIEALYTVKRYGFKSDEQLVTELITLLLQGALKS